MLSAFQATRWLIHIGLLASIVGLGGCTRVEVLEEVIVSSEEEALVLGAHDCPSEKGQSCAPNTEPSTIGYISHAAYQGPGNRDHYYSANKSAKSAQYAIDPAKIPCTCAPAKTKGWCEMRSAIPSGEQNFAILKFNSQNCLDDCTTAPQAALKVCNFGDTRMSLDGKG